MTNLIAYLPTVNKRHIDWFKTHPSSCLTLISQDTAQTLLPRLSRNIAALDTNLLEEMLIVCCRKSILHCVDIFSENLSPELCFKKHDELILADEDVSHVFAEKYLIPFGINHLFEVIWARADMTAVKRQSPVMPDVVISHDKFDKMRMNFARSEAKKSSDWWRQIGAALFLRDGHTVVFCNSHQPTEYTLDIFGDPRMNYDAGQIGKYSSFHAEMGTIVCSADFGFSTRGGSIYTTVFPCEYCARGIVYAGINEVFFEEGYSALDAFEVLSLAGVKITQIKN